MKKLLLFFAVILIFTACTGGSHRGSPEIVEGKRIVSENGVVVSAHPQGSQSGVMILQKGGNAVDAAVATGFALAVCFPEAGNIGGGGFMLFRSAKGEFDLIDYREKAPLGASRDMYLDSSGKVIDKLSTDSHLAAGVPGSVDGLIKIHAKYGRLKFSEVIKPAIDLARNGFILTGEQALYLNWKSKTFLQHNPDGCAFLKEGGWKTGDTLRQPELAETLERIRDKGRDGFYSGKTAELIIREMKRGNGLIDEQDLKEYNAVYRKPLSALYRGYKVVTCPPPSAGGIILLQLLAMVEEYPLNKMDYHSAAMIHLILEAEKRAFADRAEYAGDDDFINIPVSVLLSREYLAERMADFEETKATSSASISAGKPQRFEKPETTHYSVVDASGNAVAATTTLNGGYGSGIVVEGAGFLLNNEMDDFSLKPDFPNMYGLTGSDANSIEPGKRMLSSMTPVIVEKEGKLFLVAGTPGGSTIPTTVFQVIINVIDYNMNIWQAVDTGRFHHQWLPDRITFELNSVSTSVLNQIKAMGHEMDFTLSLGSVNAVCLLPDGRMQSAADRRGDNQACGY